PGQENEGPDGYDDIFYIDDEEFENGRASILCDLCVEAEFFETGTFEDVATLSLDAGWELIGHPKGTTFVCKDCKERAIQECPKKIGGAAVHD
ncbi:hypothetical protein GWN42_09425, partial [candidate division KSB1 bacterium]|nr:hypothetical protein [candidate division KSB1 bacterium]